VRAEPKFAPRSVPVVVGLAVLIEAALYSAITPLLPAYTHRFGLSSVGAGVLASSYAAGAVIGTLPAVWLTRRAGARPTLFVGLGCMAAASMSFGLASNIVSLDVARATCGVGASMSFAGGMGWLVGWSSEHRRGAVIGTAMTAGVIGFLAGPLLGAVARDAGQQAPFAAIAATDVALAASIWWLPSAPPLPAGGLRNRFVRDRQIRAGAWLVLVAALVFGAIEVLVPLRLDALGANGVTIAVTFLAAAAAEGCVQMPIGKGTDRWGRARAIRASLVGVIASLAALSIANGLWLIGGLVVAVNVVCGALNTAAMTLLSDGVDSVSLDQAAGFALINGVWATGQVIGAAGGGALASKTSDAAVYLIFAGLCASTFATLRMLPTRRPEISGE
jgi:MFS family permease